MEILDLYDDNLNKLNETVVRGSNIDRVRILCLL